ncbi:MAG: hypothetical protein IV086_03450 [Hyphomonadaceae bacterium]|nr:hypothetical protein [Hyphomonadaceae bacterium]
MNFAHWLMKFARAAAPDNRAEWTDAMSAEFATLERNANQVAWAAGCLGTVVMWRLQASALYLIALTALSVMWNIAIGKLIVMASASYAFSQPISQEEMGDLWMTLVDVGKQATLFLIAAALCAYRPRYALVSATILWLATTGANFLSMFGPEFALLLANAPFNAENNHPALPNVVMALIFAGNNMWPVVVGGFAGWAFAHGKRPVAAVSAGTLALLLGFAEFRLDPGDSDPVLSTFSMAAYTLIAAALILALITSSVATLRDFRRAWNEAA